ncbi:hypothetical protein FA95DRAFT_1562025 [Auriscalpium vulgare]|uniref:Uncharacterized protein n=1 Tax=Auriscalpium vulgare TaxID=40419 RepID=A0ACB8RKJ6_9AGAM|nr:hypothetical protein FA95DRAFT_1562025 [Auriscalpium vulgare]
MPVTRASTAQSRTFSSPYASRSPPPISRKAKAPAASSSDVIVISSDEEDTKPAITARRKGKGKSRMLAAKASLEIIELSDSTRSVSSAAPSSNDRSELRRVKDEAAKLRADVARLKQENARNKDLYNKYLLENEHLRSQKKLQAASVPVTLLEDVVCCEICTAKMWSPFLMPDCGHTFCQTCITDWFTTIRTKHLATNPHLNEHTLLTLPPALRPQYTCPACRTTVRTCPVECFTLKTVVRVVADAVGESSPRKSGPSRGRAKQGGVWDGFFGANR